MQSHSGAKFCALLALGVAVSAHYTCNLKSAPASHHVCGTIGYIHHFDYYIQDLFAAGQITEAGCAAACAATPGCLSAALNPGEFCE